MLRIGEARNLKFLCVTLRSGLQESSHRRVTPSPDRGFADMVNYLRWEEELGHKPESTEGGGWVSVPKRQEGAPLNLG